MASTFTIAGAQINVYLNGNRLNQVTSFSFRSAENRRPVYAVDQNEPYEFIPTTSTVQGTLHLVRVLNDGGSQGLGMSGGIDNMVNERYFSLLVTERSTDAVLFNAPECSLTDESWDMSARGVVGGTIDFLALTWNNEAIPPPIT